MTMNNREIKKKDVLIIDYGVGNHLSIINALEFLGYSFSVSDRVEDIREARSYILPGVGAFQEAKFNLKKLGIIEVLDEQVLGKKKPILGICLGMQIMAEDSEENGFCKGFGWFKGHIVRIKETKDIRVPHVGWNNVRIIKKYPLFSLIYDEPHFYFDHSYHFKCDEKDNIATCSYGQEITAAVQKDNIFGVQFHPEKSQTNGLKLFRSYFNYIREKRDQEVCLKKGL